MKIPDLNSNIRLNIEPSNNRALQNLRSGQLLQAQVLSQTAQGAVKIRLGSLEVTAKTDIRLSPGQKLALEVIKTGTLPELRLRRAPDLEMLKTEALRSILPKQMPVARLIENLQSLLPHLSGASNLQAALEALPGNPGRPESDLTSIMRLIASQGLGANEPVTAERLRQLLKGSGLFLESRLASGLAPAPSDLKSSLLRLLFQLRPRLASQLPRQNSMSESAQERRSDRSALPDGSPLKPLVELLSQTEGALSRVRMNQLISLPADEGTRQAWQFEIPMNRKEHTDSFLVRLEQEHSGGKTQLDQRWIVTIEFDLEPLGPVSARLNLQQEEISSHFTAEKAVTAARLEQELPKLNQAFLKAGLKVGNLSARPGNIEKSDTGIPLPNPLLDEKA